MKENDIITDVDPIDDDCWSTVTACDGKRGTFLSNSEEVLERGYTNSYFDVILLIAIPYFKMPYKY